MIKQQLDSFRSTLFQRRASVDSAVPSPIDMAASVIGLHGLGKTFSEGEQV